MPFNPRGTTGPIAAGYRDPEIINSERVYKQQKALGHASSLLDKNVPLNPPFDSRIWSQAGFPGQPRLVRGRITNIRENPLTHKWHSLNFLWNPSDINVGYGFNESALGSEFMTSDQMSADNLVSGQEISFKLRFDRTYELHNNPENLGCLVDVGAFENMVSAFDGTNMRAVPVMAVLGATPSMKAFSFTGWITQAQIFYLSFSYRMIPQRVDIAITLSRKYFAEATANAATVGSGGTGGAGSGSAGSSGASSPAFGYGMSPKHPNYSQGGGGAPPGHV